MGKFKELVEAGWSYKTPVYDKFKKAEGKNYGEQLTSLGDEVHSLIKELEQEKNELQKEKGVKAGLFHDNYIKAYKSMKSKGDLKESEEDELNEDVSDDAKKFMVKFNKEVSFLKEDIKTSSTNSDWKNRLESISILIAPYINK